MNFALQGGDESPHSKLSFLPVKHHLSLGIFSHPKIAAKKADAAAGIPIVKGHARPPLSRHVESVLRIARAQR
jgi:hypothetical protein